jgi:putative transposon-encoded protein
MIDLGKTYNQIHISITNILGQEIQIQKHHSSNKIKLILNEKAGVYFVNVSTKEGKSAVIKVLKK